jgi:hypothetical protein
VGGGDVRERVARDRADRDAVHEHVQDVVVRSGVIVNVWLLPHRMFTMPLGLIVPCAPAVAVIG